MKTRLQIIVWIMAIASFVLLPVVALFAGTPKEKARAAVNVARTRLELGKRAELPDSNGRSGAAVDAAESVPLAPVPEGDGRSLQPGDDLARPEVENHPEIAETTWQPVPPRQMQVTFESTPIMTSGPRPLRAQLLIRSVAGCAPCKRLHREIQEKLRPLNWSIGVLDHNQIRFEQVETDADITFPWITLYQNGEQITEWHGYQSTEFLSTELRKAWDSAADVPAVAASGYGGSLKGRAYIESSLAWWRENIGTTKPDGTPIKVQAAWRRTGAQTFPLLRQKPEQWSCANIMGQLGEFAFEAPGSLLPVPEVTLGYKRSLGRVRLIGEVSVAEQQLGFPGDRQANAVPLAVHPAGFGPMELLTIVQTVQAIVSLLNPQVDLQLGGQITATAWLDDSRNAIHVEFHDCPRIKIVEWWTFDLGVKQLIVDPKNVHIDVDGSRLIKSRDFKVE